MQVLEFLSERGSVSRNVPVSAAVRVGDRLFVSGTPAFDGVGGIAVGNFAGQMRQVMANIAAILSVAGVGWNRVAKVGVMLTRREDFATMNQIYATYFDASRYPARTTVIVTALPHADFLLEIECEAVLG